MAALSTDLDSSVDHVVLLNPDREPVGSAPRAYVHTRRHAAAPGLLAVRVQRRGRGAAHPAGADQDHLAGRVDQHLLRPSPARRGHGGGHRPPAGPRAGHGSRPTWSACCPTSPTGPPTPAASWRTRSARFSRPRPDDPESSHPNDPPLANPRRGSGLEVVEMERRDRGRAADPVRLQPVVGAADGRAVPGGAGLTPGHRAYSTSGDDA